MIENIHWWLYEHSEVFRNVRHFYLYVLKIHWWQQIIILVCAVVMVCLCIKKKKRKGYVATATFLLTYILTLFASLVFSRPIMKVPMAELKAFWTMKAVFMDGETKYIQEIVLNLLMLMPVGGCLAAWNWKTINVALFGFCLSLSIELLQYVTCTGLCEFDDVMYNTAGCMCGLLVFKVYKRVSSQLNTHKFSRSP